VETRSESGANPVRVGLGKGKQGTQGKPRETRGIYPTEMGSLNARLGRRAALFGWKTFFPNFEGKHPTPS
jgi:hypothetical protein